MCQAALAGVRGALRMMIFLFFLIANSIGDRQTSAGLCEIKLSYVQGQVRWSSFLLQRFFVCEQSSNIALQCIANEGEPPCVNKQIKDHSLEGW